MLIFLLVIIGLSLLILGHEAGHFFVAKLFGLKVDEFGFGFPPRIWSWQSKRFPRKSASSPRQSAVHGETVYSVNWLPFGGFVRIAGESDRIADGAEKLEALPEAEKKRYFYFQPAWKKGVVIAAGVAVNFLLGWIMLSVVLMIGLPQAIIVSEVQPGSPAEAAGIVAGDAITGFSGAKEFIDFVDASKGKEISLSIKRDGEEVVLGAVPRLDAPAGEGALGVFFVDGGEEKMGFFSAIAEGFIRSLMVSWAIIAALFNLVANLLFNGHLLEGVVGPVGVFSVAYDAGGLGMAYLLQLIALISLNLAVVNLIPFPALDGGRLLLIGIEKIKGSPVPRSLEAWVNGLGFAALIFIMVLLSVRDIDALL